MDKKVWIIGGVIILGGATAYILLNKKAASAATVVTEPYTDNPVSTSEQIATTNTPAVIAAIPDSSFVGVTANGTTINTNTTPVGTTYSKYPVGSQLTFSNSSVAGRIYTVTAIQSGYYVMSYSGGGPLTIQVTIVDTDSAWGLYVPGVSATPAPAAPAYVAPAVQVSTPDPVYVAQPAGPLPTGISEAEATSLLIDPSTAIQVVAAPNNAGNTIFNFVPGPGFGVKL